MTVFDSDDVAVVLSEELNFDSVYRVRLWQQSALFPPTQNHSLVYSPTTNGATSLFKSPNLTQNRFVRPGTHYSELVTMRNDANRPS